MIFIGLFAQYINRIYNHVACLKARLFSANRQLSACAISNIKITNITFCAKPFRYTNRIATGYIRNFFMKLLKKNRIDKIQKLRFIFTPFKFV